MTKNFSLDWASLGITSKSSQYYWEIGRRSMPFEKVVAMLKRMQIPYEELDSGLKDNYQYIAEIVDTYLNENSPKLKQIVIAE